METKNGQENNNRLIAFNIIDTKTHKVIHNTSGVPGLLYLSANDILNIELFEELIEQCVTLINYYTLIVTTIDYTINDKEDDDFNTIIFKLSDSKVPEYVSQKFINRFLNEIDIPSDNLKEFINSNNNIVSEKTIRNYIRAKLQDYNFKIDDIESILLFLDKQYLGK